MLMDGNKQQQTTCISPALTRTWCGFDCLRLEELVVVGEGMEVDGNVHSHKTDDDGDVYGQ